MNITYRTDKDILYIGVSGRIDASNASAAEEKIFEIKSLNQEKHTVIDAEELEYISSAGLRVILKLRKEDSDLEIINVVPEVYEILDMTGFTDMVTVERAFRRLSIEGCEFLAKGANGAVYRYDDETVVKTYFAKDALPEIRQERENSRRAFVLGINTAMPYGIVRVGDGYGTVTELLNATSITKMIRKDEHDIDQPVKYFIDMLKSIHSTEAAHGTFPDMKEIALDWADFVMPHLPEDKGAKLRALVQAVPESNNLLHGDYHTGNVMVQNGEPLLIDMDTLCMGHPIFELGSMFNAFIGYSELDHQVSMDFFGYSFEASARFWEKALRLYIGTDDKAVFDTVSEKAQVIGYMRMLRRAIRRPNEPASPAKIARCKEMLCMLLDKVDSLEF